LKEHREPAAGSFDLPGFLLAGGGFSLVMYALSEGPSHGWTSLSVLTPGLIGIVVLASFVVVEVRTREPMVKLKVLGDRLFRNTSIVSLFASAGFLGVLFLVPLFLQEARGASPLSSGLTTFPEALGVVTSTQLVAYLYPRIGPRRLMCGGLVWVAAMMTLLTTIDVGTSAWIVRILMFSIGVGMAYVFLPSQAAAFATISRADTGRAATLSSVQRQLGSATGVALVSSVLALVGPTRIGADGAVHAHLAAYHAAFLVSASLALIGAFMALNIPDRDAAVTMQLRARGRRTREAVVAEAD
jgi:predicted MFS family arabinose efflux permease